MKKIAMYTLLLLVMAVCVLSTETKYSFIGSIIFVIIVSMLHLKDFFVYRKNKKEISDTNFIARRSGNITRVINCFVVCTYCRDHFIKDKVIETNNKIILISILTVYILWTIYIIIVNRPLVSGQAFLCSNGKLIRLEEVKTVRVKNSFIKPYKKMNVECEKEEFAFNIKDHEYESLKNLINLYNYVEFIED